MREFYSETIIEIINNEIEILANRIRNMHSVVVNQDEFLEHLAKRKEQLSFIVNNFEGYMYFVEEHLSGKTEVKPMQKKSISIEMAAVDVLLGKRIKDAVDENNVPTNDFARISYLSDRGYRLNWLLSHIDIDNTLAEYTDRLSHKSNISVN